MTNKEIKVKGIKNYWIASNDGQITKGIDKRMKKPYRKIARHRLKREVANERIKNMD